MSVGDLVVTCTFGVEFRASLRLNSIATLRFVVLWVVLVFSMRANSSLRSERLGVLKDLELLTTCRM